MASTTATRPKGTPRVPETARSQMASFRDAAGTWLNHPMASFVLVLVPAVLLCMLGTAMVLSASSVFAHFQFGDSYYFLKRQAVFLALGLIAGTLLARLAPEKLRPLGWIIFGAAGLLLVATFIPGVGYGVKGNRNWINFGSGAMMLRLQPSEFAKLAIILWGATVLDTKRRLLDQPKHLLVPFLPGSLILIGLVLLQHDLGTALVMGAIVIAVLWCVGSSWRVLGSIAAIVAAGAVFLVATNAGRLTRVLAFLDPSADPTGTNHQANQALYGMATGGWWGVGIGASRQKWGSLVEAHTDYVLAIIGEELGLVGTLAVLALFCVLGYAGFRIALRSATFYSRIVAGGITCWLMLQTLINVMVVLRLLPVLGVPLPLVSYGGSALLANLMAVGLLLACAREEPDAKRWLERQRAKKQPRRRLSAVLPGRRRN
ncbi:putative lipid II flippase FtsW [Nigerium massiliense]|uniref:putative lipid II flippase FtsW n=1 Tax=Nigerium massiliense TaxID=1522317 RepID=UPI000AAB6200|nr:putative lipid II flippase FtsW [Nigerium massiliense]